jgi:elongation factor G
LHLEIYVERMRREYGLDCVVGPPRVAYRETILRRVPFNYLHRKQSGGSGQYAKVEGFLEPLDPSPPASGGDGASAAGGDEGSGEGGAGGGVGVGADSLQFVNKTVGGSVPPQYIGACEKGFRDAGEKGPLIGHPLAALRMVR